MSDVAQHHDGPAQQKSSSEARRPDTDMAEAPASQPHHAEDAVDALIDSVERLDDATQPTTAHADDAQEVPDEDLDGADDINAVIDAAFVSLGELEMSADQDDEPSTAKSVEEQARFVETAEVVTPPVANEAQVADVATTAQQATLSDDPRPEPECDDTTQIDSLVGDVMAQQVNEMCASQRETQALADEASCDALESAAIADSGATPHMDAADAHDAAAAADCDVDFNGVFEDAADVVPEMAGLEDTVQLTAASTDDVPGLAHIAADESIPEPVPADDVMTEPQAAVVEDDPYAAPGHDEPASGKRDDEEHVAVVAGSGDVASTPASGAIVEDDPYAAPGLDEPMAGQVEEPAVVGQSSVDADAAAPIQPSAEDDPYAGPSFEAPPAEDDAYAAPTFDTPANANASESNQAAGTAADDALETISPDAQPPVDSELAADVDDAAMHSLGGRLSELLAPIEPGLRRVLVPLSRPLAFVPAPLRGVVDVIALSLPVWVPIVWVLLWYLNH